MDETTDVELRMASSGRTGLVPHEGLVGAHVDRREPEASSGEPAASRFDEPFGGGAQVAPTERAEMRERVRHELQRDQGIVPAGTERNPRQLHLDEVDRAALDDAAARADRIVSDRRRTRR